MKNILVIFMSLLVTLTASEMIFRALEITKIIPAGGITPEPPKEYMREHSAKRIKSKNPLLVAELDKTDPRVNSIGIRDREFSLEKPEGVFRIVAGWKLRLVGSFYDIKRLFKPVHSPISAETMRYATQWPEVQNAAEINALGLTLRPASDTFRDTLLWMGNNNLLDKKLLPNLFP